MSKKKGQKKSKKQKPQPVVTGKKGKK